MTILKASSVSKSYARGASALEVLRGVDLCVEAGELVSIVGPSGSGKTTLMQIIGGLDRPTAGSVELAGHRLDTCSDGALSALRRRKLGFVFQFFNLLPTLTAIENVALPLLLDGEPYSRITPKATALLEELGLAHRLRHRPEQLSGGEMQRVAIARALVADPVLILADEPTGNLDTKTGFAVLDLFRRIVRRHERTLVMVTHDPKAARFCDRIISMRDGVVESDTVRERAPRAA